MQFITFMEIVGTIAFAVTGILIAIEKELDYYGITFLAIITAIGGGIVRDLIIDRKIPSSLENPIYAVICLVTVVVVVLFYKHIHYLNRFINVCDAIGLAAFTAIGANSAISNGFNQIFIIITLGLLTGTGGGLIRDISVGRVPFVFEKEVYAVASILGAIAYKLSYEFFGSINSMYICFGVTLFIRLFCMKFNIHLGKVKRKESD